jgi:hypothetical protein
VLLFTRWQKQMRSSASESPDAKVREVVANYIDRFGDSRFSNIEAGKGEVEQSQTFWRQSRKPFSIK